MAIRANSYFLENPDVAAAFEQETYGLSPQDFAEAHFLMYGQNEQRDAPETIDPYFVSNPDVAQSYGDNRYDMTPDDFAQAHYLLYGTDEQRAQPDALNPYFVQNSDVADAYKQDRYGLSPTDFANTHFDLYGQGEQRQVPDAYTPTGMAPGAPTQIGRSPSAPGSSGGASAANYSQTTFGANSGERLGAGSANYQSDLIKSLRQADNGLMSQNPGFTGYGYTQPQTPSAAGGTPLNAAGAFNPGVLRQDVASADDVANWNNYSSYRTNSLQAKTPITSFEEWLAGGKSDGKVVDQPVLFDPFASGTVGGGN